MNRVVKRRERIRRRAVLLGIGLVMGGVSGIGLSEEEPATSSRSHVRTSSKAAPNSSAKDAQVERKLDQIIATQQAILQQFDAIMEELRIIKVRTTIRSGS